MFIYHLDITTKMELKFAGWVHIVLLIKKNPEGSISDLSKNYMSYAHTHNVIKILTQEQIIWIEKVGRKQSIGLTKKGKEICKHLEQVMVQLG